VKAQLSGVASAAAMRAERAMMDFILVSLARFGCWVLVSGRNERR
jgi:hypothetical protein